MNLAHNSHHGRIYSVRDNRRESYGNRFKFSDYFTKFLSDTVFIRQNKASLHTKGNEARTRKQNTNMAQVTGGIGFGAKFANTFSSQYRTGEHGTHSGIAREETDSVHQTCGVCGIRITDTFFDPVFFQGGRFLCKVDYKAWRDAQ